MMNRRGTSEASQKRIDDATKSRAKHRATKRLIAAHPEEFDKYLSEKMVEYGFRVESDKKWVKV
jgi:hypothetical protein